MFISGNERISESQVMIVWYICPSERGRRKSVFIFLTLAFLISVLQYIRVDDFVEVIYECCRYILIYILYMCECCMLQLLYEWSETDTLFQTIPIQC